MPADRRARPVLVNQSHGKRFGIDTSPLSNRGTQRQQECWKRPGGYPIVRLAEERHAPPCHDAAHLKVRERHLGNRFEQDELIGLRDEPLAIVEAWGEVVLEEA